MTATPALLTVTGVPRPVASAYMTVVIVHNTGTAPVRVVTQGADNGREVAPGATVEFQAAHRTANLNLVADEPTPVEVTLLTLAALRREAAEETGIPFEYIRGRDRAGIAASVAKLAALIAGTA